MVDWKNFFKGKLLWLRSIVIVKVMIISSGI